MYYNGSDDSLRGWGGGGGRGLFPFPHQALSSPRSYFVPYRPLVKVAAPARRLKGEEERGVAEICRAGVGVSS